MAKDHVAADARPGASPYGRVGHGGHQQLHVVPASVAPPQQHMGGAHAQQPMGVYPGSFNGQPPPGGAYEQYGGDMPQHPVMVSMGGYHMLMHPQGMHPAMQQQQHMMLSHGMHEGHPHGSHPGMQHMVPLPMATIPPQMMHPQSQHEHDMAQAQWHAMHQHRQHQQQQQQQQQEPQHAHNRHEQQPQMRMVPPQRTDAQMRMAALQADVPPHHVVVSAPPVVAGPPPRAAPATAERHDIVKTSMSSSASSSAGDKHHREQSWSTLQLAAEILRNPHASTETSTHSAHKSRRIDATDGSSIADAKGSMADHPSRDGEFHHKSRDTKADLDHAKASSAVEHRSKHAEGGGAAGPAHASLSWVTFGPSKPRLSTQPPEMGALVHFRRGGSF